MNKPIIDNPRKRFVSPEDMGDEASNPTPTPTMGEVIAARYTRRGLMKGALAVTAISATVSPLAMMAASPARAQAASRFNFQEIAAGVDDTHHVAPGYRADVLLRWGDPIFADAPEFDPQAQTAEKQARQFGYNNDYIGLVPVPGETEIGDRALLVVNHEYTSEELMFPGLGGPQDDEGVDFAAMTPELVNIEIMAHGGSVVEIRRGEDGRWQVVRDSPLNRRITGETEMELTGPAAGHEWLKTSADDTGTRVRGMLNNCAGGVTPWGTWLSGEENFHGYFGAAVDETGLPEVGPSESYDDPQAQEKAMAERTAALLAAREEVVTRMPNAAAAPRYGVPGGWYAWNRVHDRFDVGKEPNEPNRFGYVVEIDPTDPESMPKKRTALGRMKHEGAETIVNADGRVVVYMGDDERFDYVYKFVTAGAFDPENREANLDLLDEGTLYVARYDEDGTGVWIPLVHGEGELTTDNGWADQAQILINTRLAADAVGATPMDRPEDVQAGREGEVYVMLTNNTRREEANAANPRPDNAFGHIVSMRAPGGDHAATDFTWDILVQCGDPAVAEVGATFSAETSENGWFGMPDNCVVDSENRLWVSTDGNSAEETGRADGLWALTTEEGQEAATGIHFFRCPVGAELCGPFFTPDLRSLFVAVQHPAEGGQDWPEFGRVSTFADPSTRWPDFDEAMPPRPAVVVITKEDGGQIGV